MDFLIRKDIIKHRTDQNPEGLWFRNTNISNEEGSTSGIQKSLKTYSQSFKLVLPRCFTGSQHAPKPSTQSRCCFVLATRKGRKKGILGSVVCRNWCLVVNSFLPCVSKCLTFFFVLWVVLYSFLVLLKVYVHLEENRGIVAGGEERLPAFNCT